jgi:thiol-disulfide isomerase/thioredoxin
MRRRVLLALAGIAVASPGWAAAPAPFSDKAFADAQAAGKAVIVEIHASWCPVCAKQGPILSQLRDNDFKDAVAFAIDFDSQKDLLAKFGANRQSTIIVFRGRVEKGRSVGVSDSAALKELVARAYSN